MKRCGYPIGRYVIAWYSAAIYLACLGCGSELELVPGSGVVLREGKPVNGGKLLLNPVSAGQSAIAQIQSDGTFILSTRGAEGASPGAYRVTVITDFKHKGKDVHATCVGPRQFEISLDKEAENNYEINVSNSKGWQLTLEPARK